MFNTEPNSPLKCIKLTLGKRDPLCLWESPPHRETGWVVHVPQALGLSGSSGWPVPGQQCLTLAANEVSRPAPGTRSCSVNICRMNDSG